MTKTLRFLLAGLTCIALLYPIIAQLRSGEPSAIELAIEAKDYKKAKTLIETDISKFITEGRLDTVVTYLSPYGETIEALEGAEKSVAALMGVIDRLKKANAQPGLLVQACRDAAEFFSTIGEFQAGYDLSKLSLEFIVSDPKHTQLDISRSEYNMGQFAHRLGDVSLSLAHHRKSLKIREADSKTNPEDMYMSANAMGSLAWYASKYDSAAYYFEKGLDIVKTLPSTDINKYFRPGNILNNLAALYNADGKTAEAIAAQQAAIRNFQLFVQTKEEGLDSKIKSATEGIFEGVDNLANFYKEIGDYTKAGQLYLYSYSQKKSKLPASHPAIFISEILIGQYFNGMHQYDSALYYLDAGLAKLEKAEGDYLFWAADAWYSKALIHANRNEIGAAQRAYTTSENLYETSYQGQYDDVYMDFLRSASLFYAKNGDYPKALEQADKVKRYLESVNGENSLQAFYQMLNIGEINFLGKHYREAIDWSNNALKIVNAKTSEGTALIDSVKIGLLKPKAILIIAKSNYALTPKRDSAFLKQLSIQLEDALSILAKRRSMLDDAMSINLLLADNQQLIDFSKKIELELSRMTNSKSHLDRFINLHESALYNRIRSRLDQQRATRFAGIPASVMEEELKIKATLNAAFKTGNEDSSQVNNYIIATKKWAEHQAKVKKDYPAYYNMRYESLFRSIPELQSKMKDSSTIVRYVFCEDSLYALIIDKTTKQLVKLSLEGIEQRISSLMEHSDEQKQLSTLYELYQQLWEPLVAHIHNRKITIIPDGILYNISFEMLTPQLLKAYTDLQSNTLLARHPISYHYSLFLINNEKQGERERKNYIAFAPGFSDEVKKAYINRIEDTLNLDTRYLQLLPQPNTNKLVQKMKSVLSGKAFTDEASTKASFIKNASGHKIVHIGTHAAYDNIRPEQSGLIFAKNQGDQVDSNFLSLVDIYGCDVNSNLTILTACESGKPGYQDGEGMVSLSHAFNYAGSERLLTALWKIDEQASSMITENFLQRIKKGEPTDEALQQAKLHYLQQSSGRTLAPAYWAGMVILGEPTTIQFFAKGSNQWIWIAGIGIVALGGIVVLMKRKK